MKNFLLLIFMTSIILNADLSVNQIKKMVNKIHQKRSGVELTTLDLTKEPFVRLEVENNTSTFVIPKAKQKEKTKMVLHAILNSKAYINDNWMGVDENILGYTLKFIGKKGVILRNENNIKKLFLRKTENSFIKLEERL